MNTHETIEQFFTCPYCWQRVSIVVDPTAEDQSYIEDCEVCCRPIAVQMSISDGAVISFSAEQTGD